VKRGEFISLYLTGYGAFAGLPEDGAANGSGATTPTKPRIAIGINLVEADFSGPAPDFVGLWQINFRVPDNVAPGAAPIGVLYRDINSNVPNDQRFARPIIMVQ
jgi:uncharacterized protein (TIGR03437 family)